MTSSAVAPTGGRDHRWVYVGMEKRPGGVDATWLVHLICACGARESRHCATWREADSEKERAAREVKCATCGTNMRGTWPTCRPTCSACPPWPPWPGAHAGRSSPPRSRLRPLAVALKRALDRCGGPRRLLELELEGGERVVVTSVDDSLGKRR